MKIRIYETKKSEKKIIYNLIKESLKELKLPLTSLEYYITIIERLLKGNGLVLSAYVNKDFAGFVAASTPEGGVSTILWLIVKSKYRNNRIGSSLFNEVCIRLKSIGCHKIKLTTPNNNSIEFYKKQGMFVEGFHPSHWWKVDFWSLGKFL